jgi:hypothetical protein
LGPQGDNGAAVVAFMDLLDNPVVAVSPEDVTDLGRLFAHTELGSPEGYRTVCSAEDMASLFPLDLAQ